MKRLISVLVLLATALIAVPVAASGESAAAPLPPRWIENFGDGTSLDSPQDAVVMKDGSTFVVSSTKVSHFDKDGVFQSSFGSFGGATGIALGSDGNLYISDSGNDRVEVVTTSGVFVRIIGSSGSGPSQLDYPEDVAFDIGGQLLVADRFNSRIQVFTATGTHVTNFATQTANPMAIDVNGDGRIFVASLSGDVEIYSAGFVHELDLPVTSFFAVGVAIDAADRIWVTTTWEFFSETKVYKPDLTLIGAFGQFGSGDDEFANLADVTIDNKGRGLSVDTSAERVSIWAFWKCSGHLATWVGTNGADAYAGTPSRDVVVALGGNDVISTGAGNDLICLGNGADIAVAGSGRDKVLGGKGNDDIRGGSGRDTVLGQPGADELRGGGANDTIKGGDGADDAWGGDGDDRLEGNKGNDKLRGEGGNDAMFGGNGAGDDCRGGPDTDTAIGCETVFGVP